MDENAAGSNLIAAARRALARTRFLCVIHSRKPGEPTHPATPQGTVEKRVDSRAALLSNDVSAGLQRRLDEAKVETLRAWGEGLRIDPREEVKAAGRAITMLVEEIERLNIDLWHARTDETAAR